MCHMKRERERERERERVKPTHTWIERQEGQLERKYIALPFTVRSAPISTKHPIKQT